LQQDTERLRKKRGGEAKKNYSKVKAVRIEQLREGKN